jgi:tyrosinase
MKSAGETFPRDTGRNATSLLFVAMGGRFMKKGAVILLAGWALGVVATEANAQVAVDIQLRETASHADDFICWTPVRAAARLLAPSNADQVIVVKGIGESSTSGQAEFLGPASNLLADASVPQLQITLPKDGSWAKFAIVGTRASTNGKDVTIRAETPDGKVLGNLSLMVRVRKDAESLTPGERDAFLQALATWKEKLGLSRPTRFEDYYTTHADAFSLGIHSEFGTRVSNFLPWHRAFILNFERELQEIDPTVALPYWKFDAPAPHLFSDDFLGSLNSGSNSVVFGATNPLQVKLQGWSLPSGEALSRAFVFPDRPAVNPKILSTILCDASDPTCPTTYRATTDSIETSYHNNAHSQISGWLSGQTSPSDPLFFLLHANVDRAWAKWQALRGRFKNDGADQGSYTPIGTYPGLATTPRYRKGLYALDEMWPWGAPPTGNDALARWLPYTFVFPGAEGLPLGGNDRPTPAKLIDYLGKGNVDSAHGVCYDDVVYR